MNLGRLCRFYPLYMKNVISKPLQLSLHCGTSSSSSFLTFGINSGSLLLNSKKNTNLSAPVLQYVNKRFFHKKKTIRIPPTKPLNFDYSGDIVTELAPVDPTKPRLEYEGCDELFKSDERIQQMLSMKFSDGPSVKNRRVYDLVERVKEHELDTSPEVKISAMTVKIRNQMRHCMAFRKDKRSKSQLIEHIQARNKWLRRLRRDDGEKYEWLSKELQVQYVGTKLYNYPISRRAARKRAAREAAIKVKKEKMLALKSKMDAHMGEFIQHKEAELRDICAQAKALGVEDTSSMSGILSGLKAGTPLDVPPEKQKTRREMLLEKKFEMYAKKNPRDRT